jgi:hypothetical protein
MNNIPDELMDTQDMGLAVALLCKNYELVDLERPLSGKRITFRFQGKNGLNQAARDYWSGKLLVDPKQYWNESKNLKTRLYSLG